MTRRNALKALGMGTVGALLSTETFASADVIAENDILVLSVRPDCPYDCRDIARQIVESKPELKGRVLVVNGLDVNVVRGKGKQ